MTSTTTLARLNRGSLIRTILVWLGWTTIAAVGVYFYRVAVGRYIHFDVTHYRHYWISRWWLVAHLGGGSLALILGPFQFSTALRQRYIKVHRWIGRTYLSGVLIGSIAAVYMSFNVSPNKAFGVALLFLALAWVTTSSMGLIAVLRRQFAAHREWMIRSYVVTFAFVSFRLLKDLNVFGRLDPESQSVMRGWVAWAVPLLLAEVILQWRRTIGPGRIPDRVLPKGVPRP